MTISPAAGKPASKGMLVDVGSLEREYFARKPDPEDPAQQVAFGTSGHRVVAARLVHRGAHPGHHPGHLRETLFIVSSKTFTTLETMTNVRTARAWSVDALGGDDASVWRRSQEVTWRRSRVSRTCRQPRSVRSIAIGAS